MEWNVDEIEKVLEYVFADKALLAQALVHRSYINEHREVAQHNERLEFLGDSVLGLVIADYVFRTLPGTPEGELSFLRSRLVEASSCMSYAQKLGVDRYLLLGKGERMSEGRGRDSIVADLLEALVGAIYIDGGLEAARAFIFQNFRAEIEAILRTPIRNWKAILQDIVQKEYQQTPVYEVLGEHGPDHSKAFDIGVMIQGREAGRGSGNSKKEAQQAAAQDALVKMKWEDHGR